MFGLEPIQNDDRHHRNAYTPVRQATRNVPRAESGNFETAAAGGGNEEDAKRYK